MPYRFAARSGLAAALALAVQLGLTAPAPAESATEPPAGILGESDQIMLGMVDNACKTGDYRTLVEMMSRSAMIRHRYSAASIELTQVHPGNKAMVRKVAVADYVGLPITMIDYSYVPAADVANGDPTLGLVVEFNQASDSRVAVDWTLVHYLQPEGGGEERGTPVNLDGTPWQSGDPSDGTLLLYPTADCFELVADTRYLRK